MRIAFFGTPEFAWDILRWLLQRSIPNPSLQFEGKGLEIVLVVSQPDKAVWRKKELIATPVKQIALDAGINVMQPEKLKIRTQSQPSLNSLSFQGKEATRDFQDTLKKLDLDFLVVVAYGKIIPTEILDIPKYGCINLHGSILPRYRWASPVQAAVKSGQTETGLTTMYMSEWMDEWDILQIQKVTIESDDTSEDIFEKFSEIWAKLLVETLEWVISGEISAVPQDASEATYCGKICREDGEVIFQKQSAEEIYNTYRAYTLWPGIYTWYEGRRLVLEEVTLSQPFSKRGEQESVPPLSWKETEGEWVSGFFIKISKNRYGIVCSDWEILEILRVKLEGKKSMDAMSFVNGNREVLGYCFS